MKSMTFKVMVPVLLLTDFAIFVYAVDDVGEALVPATALTTPSSKSSRFHKAPIFSGAPEDWPIFEILFSSFLYLTAGELTKQLVKRSPRKVLNADADAGPIVTQQNIDDDAVADEVLWHMLLQCISDRTIIRYLIPFNHEGHRAYDALSRRSTGNPTDHLMAAYATLMELRISNFANAADFVSAFNAAVIRLNSLGETFSSHMLISTFLTAVRVEHPAFVQAWMLQHARPAHPIPLSSLQQDFESFVFGMAPSITPGAVGWIPPAVPAANVAITPPTRSNSDRPTFNWCGKLGHSRPECFAERDGRTASDGRKSKNPFVQRPPRENRPERRDRPARNADTPPNPTHTFFNPRGQFAGQAGVFPQSYPAFSQQPHSGHYWQQPQFAPSPSQFYPPPPQQQNYHQPDSVSDVGSSSNFVGIAGMQGGAPWPSFNVAHVDVPNVFSDGSFIVDPARFRTRVLDGADLTAPPGESSSHFFGVCDPLPSARSTLVDSGASCLLLSDSRRFVSLQPYRTTISLAKGSDRSLIQGRGMATIFPGHPPIPALWAPSVNSDITSLTVRGLMIQGIGSLVNPI